MRREKGLGAVRVMVFVAALTLSYLGMLAFGVFDRPPPQAKRPVIDRVRLHSAHEPPGAELAESPVAVREVITSDALVVRVTDHHAQPLEGAVVRCVPKRAADEARPGEVMRTGLTDSSGQLDLGHVRDGDYTIDVRHDKFLPSCVQWLAQDGHRLCCVTMDNGETIRGRILRYDDVPVPGSAVVMYQLPAGVATSVAHDPVRCIADGDGYFSIGGLAPQDYEIVCQAPGYAMRLPNPIVASPSEHPLGIYLDPLIGFRVNWVDAVSGQPLSLPMEAKVAIVGNAGEIHWNAARLMPHAYGLTAPMIEMMDERRLFVGIANGEGKFLENFDPLVGMAASLSVTLSGASERLFDITVRGLMNAIESPGTVLLDRPVDWCLVRLLVRVPDLVNSLRYGLQFRSAGDAVSFSCPPNKWMDVVLPRGDYEMIGGFDALSTGKLRSVQVRPDGNASIVVDVAVERALRIVATDKLGGTLSAWTLEMLKGLDDTNKSIMVRGMVVHELEALDLVNCPRGRYEVVVRTGGQTFTGQVDVKDGLPTVLRVHL